MPTMNQSEYAKHAGVDRKTVARWIKAGKYIVMSGDLIDVEATDAVLAQYRDGKDLRISNAKKKPVASTLEEKAASNVEALLAGDGEIRSIEESKAIKEYYLAELARLEYEEKESLLLPWGLMLEEVSQEYANIRTRLLAIGPEHGPRLRVLASTTNDKGFVEAIQRIIHEVMDGLSIDRKTGAS